MHEMKKMDCGHMIEREVELLGDYTIRDERAVKRIADGLLKLCQYDFL